MGIKKSLTPLMRNKVNIFTWRISSLRCSICSEIHSGFSIITSLNPLFITGKKQRCSLETLFSQATWSFFWNFAKSVRISSTMIGVHAPAYFCQFTPKIESPYIRNWYIKEGIKQKTYGGSEKEHTVKQFSVD